MRLLRVFILFLLISLNAYSGSWIDIGIKGGYGASQLYNKNVWKDRSVVNKLSGAYQFGGKLGYNFNLNFEMTLDFIYGKSSQIYEFNFTELSLPSQDKKVTWKTFNIPLLFRHNSDQGNFFEIGGFLSFTSGDEEVYKEVTTDISPFFSKTNYGATIGVGSFMLGGDNIYLTFGGRVNIGLGDIISDVGGRNTTTYYPITNQEIETNYSTYEKTTPISIVFNLELNYDLGYIAKSNCKRQAFIFF